MPQTKEKSAEVQKYMRYWEDDNEFSMFTLLM